MVAQQPPEAEGTQHCYPTVLLLNLSRNNARTVHFSSPSPPPPYLLPSPEKRKQSTGNGVRTGEELAWMEQLVQRKQLVRAVPESGPMNGGKQIASCVKVEPAGAQWWLRRRRFQRRMNPAPPGCPRRRGRAPSTRRNAEQCTRA
jgi:hypothetical protein